MLSGPNPELVEESAISVCLEIEPLLRSLLQIDVNTDHDDDIKSSTEEAQDKAAEKEEDNHDLIDALNLILQATSTEIFKARTGIL